MGAASKDNVSDFLIVGGGFAGLTAALLLAKTGTSIIILEKSSRASSPPRDARTTAIAYGSAQILQRAGVWQDLEPDGAPIRFIEIWEGHAQSPDLVFRDPTHAHRPFGWIVDNADLLTALHRTVLRHSSIRIMDGVTPVQMTEGSVHTHDNRVFQARCVIGADGRGSFVREALRIPTRSWSYAQTALIGLIAHDEPHQGRAVEHFRPEGPFALLPFTDDSSGRPRSAFVWTVRTDEAAAFLSMPADLVTLALQARTPASYGAVVALGALQAYPLSLIHAASMIGPRTALVGDAAHGIHPIAGQGLNLGLRDLDVLANHMQAAIDKGRDIGSPEILRAYERDRRWDNTQMVAATDGLNALFSNGLPGLSLVRRLGLRGVGRIAPVQQFFIHQAMGLAA